MGAVHAQRFWLAVRRFRGKADVNQPTTLVECVENDPKWTLVGPCGRLVNFHDWLAGLDLLADSVTHDSNFVF